MISSIETIIFEDKDPVTGIPNMDTLSSEIKVKKVNYLNSLLSISNV